MNVMTKDLMRLTDWYEREQAPEVDKDPWRLRYHLMPPAGWLNDPNGLCEFRGETHVFYQYSPFDSAGGSKFWGHCTSRDLLHWKQLPPMLAPDEAWNVHGVYSGSALVDEDTMYLYYTGNVKHPGDHDYITSGRGNDCALAVSPDGRTVTFHRPVLTKKDYPQDTSCHIRDPKVWKQDDRFYMVQGARTLDDRGELLVFSSPDRVSWKHINTIQTTEPFGYMWECPDLFQVDGQWILVLSPQGISRQGDRFQNTYSCGYFPLYGDFRGECTLGDYQEMDFGFDYYAPQTFMRQGRRLMIAWVGMPDANYTNPTVARGWQHCLSVPREVHWNGSRMILTPVTELDALHDAPERWEITDAQTVGSCESADLQFTELGEQLEVTFGAGNRLVYRDGMLELQLGEDGYGRTTRRAPVGALRSLRILADTSAVELFANDGECVMTARYYPEKPPVWDVRGRCRLTRWRMKPMTMERDG